ncbi:MAG: hypothetical protein ACKVKO_02225 [Acidimicrobiales bacterium]
MAAKYDSDDDGNDADEASDVPTATAVPEVQVQSWCTLPAESSLNLVGETSALADLPFAAEPVIHLLVSLAASPRGASGIETMPGVSGIRFYFGNTELQAKRLSNYKEIDGQPFTEQSQFDVKEFSADGFALHERLYDVPGNDETLDQRPARRLCAGRKFL